MYDPQRCVLKVYREFTQQSSHHSVYLYQLGRQSAVSWQLQPAGLSVSDRKLLQPKAVQNFVLRETVWAVPGVKIG